MPTEARLKKLERAVANRQRDLVIVIEDVHDPHNIEAIFRSCDAFGVQEVYLIFDDVKRFNPKKIGKSSSSSANKWLDYHIYDSTEKCFADLHKKGFTIYGTLLHKNAKSLFNNDFIKDKKIALVIGNEHSGLSKKAIELCDQKIIIPMRGMIQSFNVSVTAAMFMFEVTRQRLQSDKDFSLTQKQQDKLLKDFINR